jgi:hypothetical protein
MENPLVGLLTLDMIKILKKRAIVSAEYESGTKTYVFKGHCYDVNSAETVVFYCGYDEDSLSFYKSQKIGQEGKYGY